MSLIASPIARCVRTSLIFRTGNTLHSECLYPTPVKVQWNLRIVASVSSRPRIKFEEFWRWDAVAVAAERLQTNLTGEGELLEQLRNSSTSVWFSPAGRRSTGGADNSQRRHWIPEISHVHFSQRCWDALTRQLRLWLKALCITMKSIDFSANKVAHGCCCKYVTVTSVDASQSPYISSVQAGDVSPATVLLLQGDGSHF